MSGYLLDTHVVLWWLDDPAELSDEARQAIGDSGNVVHVSAAAVWEMGIKKSIGRLDIPANLPDVLHSDNIQVLDNAYNGIVSGVPMPWPRFSNATGGLQRGSVIPWVGRDGKGRIEVAIRPDVIHGLVLKSRVISSVVLLYR